MAGLDPLKIFPREVWETIFEKLNKKRCSLDLLNCSRVCTEFENLLNPTQSIWLFGRICPLIFPYLSGKELLTCRRVCKVWRDVVDKFVEEFETRLPFNKESTDLSRPLYCDLLDSKKIKWTHFISKRSITECMETVEPRKRNPFVGRSLLLEDYKRIFAVLKSELADESDAADSDYEDESENEFDTADSESEYELGDEFADEDELRMEGRTIKNGFWKRVSVFMPLFGEHIWHLKLNPGIMDAKKFYQIVCQSLISLPNLKSLSINGRYEYYVKPRVPYYNEYVSSENRKKEKRLVKFLEAHPPPEIDSLETLELFVDHLPIAICEKLISGINPRNLKCLKFGICRHQFEKKVLIKLNEPLVSLTELHLSGVKSAEQLETYFDNLISPEAQLGRLSVHVSNFSYRINLDLVCQTISRRFGKSLQMLALKGKQQRRISPEGGIHPYSLKELDLPILCSLEVDGIICVPGFVPPTLKTLEYLHIRYVVERGIRETNPGMEVYKGALSGELCNSPLWVELPKLKPIRFEYSWLIFFTEKVICTRAMHERGVRAIHFDTNEDVDVPDIIDRFFSPRK